MTDVAVIDHGMGNLLSVCRAVDHLGFTPRLIAGPSDKIDGATHMILPGVGAFADGMMGMTARGLIPIVKRHVTTGKPLLGICLGMQMLFERSHEFGTHEGLSLIPGEVVRIPDDERKIPHIGWNALQAPADVWDSGLLQGIANGSSVYFVHSYMAVPRNTNLWAWVDHDGCRVTAIAGDGPIAGCQFHPEKSGPIGLRILANFLSW